MNSPALIRILKACLLTIAMGLACMGPVESKIPSRIQSPNAPVTGARYVGAAACAACHTEKSKKHAASAMAQAMFTPADCEILRTHRDLNFRNGPWRYQIKREGSGSQYIVNDGKSEFRTPILWCFGRAHSGQTYVIQRDGVYYETRVSFFTAVKGLDFTPGAPRSVPASLQEAIGQRLTPADAMACFRCHATVSPGKEQFDLQQFTPGVGCEACHGPGERHIAAMKLRDKTLPDAKQIFNPRSMHPDEMSQQFCGACHRSWETVMQMPERGGDSNIRFQPYRIANSPCYQNPDDRRISCTACHDPHEDPKREAAFYDSKCLACHQTRGVPAVKDQTAPACKTAKENCASCHMPKIEPPGLHFKFTDHQIRVVRQGDSYPRE
jgi:hypothetical protein